MAADIELDAMRKVDLLEFVVSYPDKGERAHLFGPSHVRLRSGAIPMWWAACQACQHVDLYAGVNILRGEMCVECTGSFINEMAAKITNKKPIMRAMGDQEVACAAFLVGGLAAVREMALKAAGKHDDQG